LSGLTISDFSQTIVGPSAELTAESFDLAIVSFGRQPRHGFLLSQLTKPVADMVLAVRSGTAADEQIMANFEKRLSASVVTQDFVQEAIRNLAKRSAEQGLHTCRVLVDVSCLSRVEMGGIFAALKEAAHLIEIRLSIGYCLARYTPPPEAHNPSNRRVSPVHPMFSGWTAAPNRPVDVVVSLGYEKGKALGAVEYLEPNRRWIFVPHSPEIKFIKAVRAHNRELISTSGGESIDYQVLRPRETYFSLLSLVVGLLANARPVLLPFGPKIFFAVSLLVAMSVEEVAVWHVDGDDNTADNLQQSSGHAVLMTCFLSR
jgi:hypothetical protein